uniref:ATP synthase F0 subunit 6 n=1 Tax=Ixodes scapularis TaxID=6945 RepID=UPI002237A681|nr:ATP synthase F0 subunit 6 [Ixodes scapularis]UYB78136.1 ATP synthase F0 subunit 6 [Ixodes scapularis]UYB78149.1 ATP synthase F0 subunit 6 [Ixodes scapularis]
MTNLFSIFDPSSSLNLSMNWISVISILFIMPANYWSISSRYQMLWKIIFIKIFEEIKNNLSMKSQKFIFIYLALFFSILMFNCLGLIPYVFTPSSHIILSMIMAFPLWMTLMLKGWITSFNKMMTHLVPLGSPMMLTFFMVIIETISNLIRPITLSVRLSANMISGHLLIHLLTSIPFNYPKTITIILPIMLFLMILETAVAMIQSYVFITLSSLYTNEI